MFSSQENEPLGPEERQANTDPREQHQGYETPPQWDTSAYSSYKQGYRGYDVHMEGEKLRPPQSISSKQWIWIIIAVFVALVIGGSVLNTILGSVFFLAGLFIVGYVIWRLAFNQAVQLPPQSFTVRGQYSFETNAGTIDMALLAGTAFILDAKTDLGTVSNLFGNNYAGEGPRATLHLRTHLGTISVKPLW